MQPMKQKLDENIVPAEQQARKDYFTPQDYEKQKFKILLNSRPTHIPVYATQRIKNKMARLILVNE